MWSPANIVSTIKSGSVGWAGYVTRTGAMRYFYISFVENLKVRNYSIDLDINGESNINCSLLKWGPMVWI